MSSKPKPPDGYETWLVDDYFGRNMKLETSEEFQRLRHKITKGIDDGTI